MRASYYTRTCRLCGKEISMSGLASSSHLRKHVREGDLEEVPWDGGYVRFKYPTEPDWDARSLHSFYI